MYYSNEIIVKLNRIFDQNNRSGFLRLDLNENPGGLPQNIIDEVLSGIDSQFLSQYPETMGFTRSLAEYLNADASNICLVNGSSEGIRYIIQAFTSENGRIVGVFPSYFMFQIYSEMYNRDFVKVPYESDLTMDVDNIIKELTDETQLLILLNPNNPMGNVYSEEEFKRMLSIVQEKKITLLIDEAYHYFYPKSFIKYALNYNRVFVTRTFSKFFSLAGCRLGYVVGKPEGINLVQKLCTPHNTNAFALKFANEIIKSPKIIDSLYSKFIEGREYLISLLEENKYKYLGEAGNFLFIKPKTDAKSIVDRMKNKKRILIKSYDNVGELGDCLRVTIGEKSIMKTFINALLELDK